MVLSFKFTIPHLCHPFLFTLAPCSSTGFRQAASSFRMYPPAQHGVLHGLQCSVCSATASPLAAGAKPDLLWLSPQAMGKLCSDAWSTSSSLCFLLTWVYGVVSHTPLSALSCCWFLTSSQRGFHRRTTSGTVDLALVSSGSAGAGCVQHRPAPGLFSEVNPTATCYPDLAT